MVTVISEHSNFTSSLKEVRILFIYKIMILKEQEAATGYGWTIRLYLRLFNSKLKADWMISSVATRWNFSMLRKIRLTNNWQLYSPTVHAVNSARTLPTKSSTDFRHSLMCWQSLCRAILIPKRKRDSGYRLIRHTACPNIGEINWEPITTRLSATLPVS